MIFSVKSLLRGTRIFSENDIIQNLRDLSIHIARKRAHIVLFFFSHFAFVFNVERSVEMNEIRQIPK